MSQDERDVGGIKVTKKKAKKIPQPEELIYEVRYNRTSFFIAKVRATSEEEAQKIIEAEILPPDSRIIEDIEDDEMAELDVYQVDISDEQDGE